jgi:hypothetical protein
MATDDQIPVGHKLRSVHLERWLRIYVDRKIDVTNILHGANRYGCEGNLLFNSLYFVSITCISDAASPRNSTNPVT